EQGGQKRTVAEGLLGYVLPGSTRSWPLPAGIYQPNRMSAQINARDTQWQSTPVN
ncbi:molecular chaperone, partial [Enterobacter hormaechei subsp. xiangfangensis]|nr:molecular chaperone [Enterobacter hormaechei subsp. xiangfangensis]